MVLNRTGSLFSLVAIGDTFFSDAETWFGGIMGSDGDTMSMGWLKGKSTANHRFSHEIWKFPVFFPLNQSIDNGINGFTWLFADPLPIDNFQRNAMSNVWCLPIQYRIQSKSTLLSSSEQSPSFCHDRAEWSWAGLDCRYIYIYISSIGI